MTKPKYLVDLFSCVGGFSFGSKVAGVPCLIAIDNDKRSLIIHKQTHPECRHILLELGSQTPEEFADEFEKLLSRLNVDLKDIHFHASPPCTNYSTSHPNQNTDVLDSKSGLLDWTLDVISILQPPHWSVENVAGSIGALVERHSYLFEESNNYSVYTSVTGYDFNLSVQRARVFIGKGFTIPQSIDYFTLNKNNKKKRRKTQHFRKLTTPAHTFLPGVVQEFAERFNSSIAEIAIKSPNNNTIDPFTKKLIPINNDLGEGLSQLTGGVPTPCSNILSIIYYFSRKENRWVRDRPLSGNEIARLLGFPKEYCDKIPENNTVIISPLYIGLTDEQESHKAKFSLTYLRQLYGNIVIPQIATSIIKNGLLKGI